MSSITTEEEEEGEEEEEEEEGIPLIKEKKPSSEVNLDLDNVIERLMTRGAKLTMVECTALALVARAALATEPMVLSISAPLRICGDIHGQFTDLLRIFNLAGTPPEHAFLFLGDYVDRGPQSLETICLLLAYKLKYPLKFFLLRGNHECEAVSRVYGFRAEILERFHTSKLWWTFLRTFNNLPIAAIIEDSIFCCHGGISPEFMRKNFRDLKIDINKIPKPYEIPLKGLLCDLLWADPLDQSGKNSPTGFVFNDRGCSWSFASEMVEQFLKKFDLDLIVRAHQVVEDGYEFYANKKLITIFSAPNYCGEFDNAAGIFCLDNSSDPEKSSIIDGRFLILKPDLKVKSLLMKSVGLGKKMKK